MRLLHAVALVATVGLALAASARTSVAMVIYPWCANYGKSMAGAPSCGYTSFKQCLATIAGNGGFCTANPWYQPYPPPQSYAPPLRR